MRCSRSSAKRDVNGNTILPQETWKSLKQPNLTPKAIRERTTTPPRPLKILKVSRRKEIIEINEEEIKKTIAKSNKTTSCFFEKINKID